MKAVVAAFNQEKALVGAFSVITNLRMQLFEALEATHLFAHLEDEVRVPDAGGGVEVECGHEVAVPWPRTRPEGEADTQELLLTQTVVLGSGHRS